MGSLIINKRQQARNERILQSLLHDVHGNNVCADCEAREPGWASYSLGIFLCVRCASCHRALGTHISKTKSISMDHWTPEQLEMIKRMGNVASNRIYNPRNIRPVLPMDADMIDNAMEKYVRDKYQRRTLAAGGHPMTHNTGSTTSTDDQPPPPPPKPAAMFPPNLRSASATFPLSRREQPLPQLPPESRHDPNSARSLASRRGSFNSKLNMLKDMGFQDGSRNAAILKGLSGNLEKTIESLIRLGEGRPRSEQASQVERHVPPQQPQQTTRDVDGVDYNSYPRSASQPQVSNQAQGPAFVNHHTYFNAPLQARSVQSFSIEQQMQAMHLGQGQPLQKEPGNWYDTIPMNRIVNAPSSSVSPAPYQAISASGLSNQVQSFSSYTSPQLPVPANNPFLQVTRTQTFPTDDVFGRRQPSPTPIFGPTALPSQQTYAPDVPNSFAPNQNGLPPFAQPLPQAQPSITNYYPQSQSPFQISALASPQYLDQWAAPTFAQPYNPFFANESQSQQPSPARIDKNGILALFSQSPPPTAPSFAAVPSVASENALNTEAIQQPLTNSPYRQEQRSVTMPASMDGLSRPPNKPNLNPFASSITATSPTAPGTTATGHVRQESKEFSGFSTINGRHSPDAFANLSARYA